MRKTAYLIILAVIILCKYDRMSALCFNRASSTNCHTGFFAPHPERGDDSPDGHSHRQDKINRHPGCTDKRTGSLR